MPEILDDNTEPLISRVKRDLMRARSADIALGQFFLPEFAAIAEEATHLQRLRLLIGSNAERHDLAEILDAQARLDAAQQALNAERLAGRGEMQQRVARLADSVRRAISKMPQSETDERAIESLLRLLQSGALEVRAYVRERLENDLFLAEFQGGKGAAICGSGNLLIPEPQNTTSFWMRMPEADDRTIFKQRFDQWWRESQPFKEPLLREVRGSWAMQPTTPYLLYLHVLNRLVADRLLEDAKETEVGMPDGFPPLTDFQQVAVQQALTILRQHSGVFVADVVGLGKTYIGAALLKMLCQQGQRATIFCPAALVPMWDEFNHLYGLSAVVVSTGKLLQENSINLNEPIYQTVDRQIVLIDESHRFRNRDTNSYRILSQYSQGRRCILLTATPYSLRPRDIYSQIRLFAEDDLDLDLNPPRLNEFFRRIDDNEASLVDVLRKLLIRRTRKHIQKHYPDSTIRVRRPDGTEVSQPLMFPKREKPQIVHYDVEGVYGGGLYDYIVDKLGRPGHREDGQYILPKFRQGEMTYARYGLYNYVLPEYQSKEPYTDLRRAGYAVRGFIRILLFKRLESSIEAFRATVRAILHVHERFLTALANGYVPAGDQGQSILYDQNWDDDAQLLEALSALDGRYSPAAFDLPRLERDLRNDCDVLRELDGLLAPITPDQDAKLQTLRSLLTNGLKGQKALVFTQFETTAEYLSENITDLPQTAWLSGRHRTAGRTFMQTLARFAPNANPQFTRAGAEPINILVATDVLSEGLNLQDCSLVINYDLHWNPVRLIQRIGRVDRVGSQAESIWLYNFLPERNVEKVLRLEEVLRQRIAEIHNFIGEDNAILHPDEQLNDADLYAAYTQPPDAEDKDPTALAVDFTEIEERIRQLQREQPDIMQSVRELPAGVRTARRAPDGKPGAFLYFAAEGYEQLFLAEPNGEIRTSQIEEVLAAIECDPQEPSFPLPRRHNVLVSESLRRFEMEAARRQTDRRTGPQLTPGQRYVLRHLSAVIKAEGNEDRRNFLNNVERAIRARLPEAALRELNTIRRLGLIGDPLRQRLEQAYRDLDLGRYIRHADEPPYAPTARVVCSEAMVTE